MTTFKFQWKRRWFWYSKNVSGFSFDKERDRMCLYFPDGACYEIAHFSECDCFLGKDLFKLRHTKMEQEAGQTIPIRAKI